MFRTFAAVGVLGCVVVLAGCAGPRFVSVSPDSGIVAIPSNSNYWPTYHRDKADAMIRQRFPQGYEVVHEEEVVVGTRTASNVHTHTTHDPGPSADFQLGPKDKPVTVTVDGPDQVHQHTQHFTTVSDVKEWRIHVRARPNSPSTHGPIVTTGAVSATTPSAPPGPPPPPSSPPSR